MAFTWSSASQGLKATQRGSHSQLLQVLDLREGVGLHGHDGVVAQVSAEGHGTQEEFRIHATHTSEGEKAWTPEQ